MGIRQPYTAIHMLDDDSLLNIFSLCRPLVFEENKYGNLVLGNWGGERWWYRPAQVCRRWRYLIFASASHLGLCLLCTRGTPIANMLAHSPPFPLIIYYHGRNHHLTAEDEEGMMLALQHPDRVRRIYLHWPVPSLLKLVPALTGEFPALEFLCITTQAKHDIRLTLPPTFKAPQLRHLILDHFTSPIRYPFLTIAIGLVTLVLRWIHPSTYPHITRLLQTISLSPQLERLQIGFLSPVSNREIENQLLHTPITTHITFPNLRQIRFQGNSGCLEALLSQMTAPLLEALNVHFFNQPSFSVTRLLHFINSTNNLRLRSARLLFYHEAVTVFLYPHLETRLPSFYVKVTCRHLDWQVSSVAQIFKALRPLCSSVVDLTLDYREHTLSSEWHNEVDRTLWCEFLGSFRNVKTLRVQNGLVDELTRSLRLDEEPPLELLPDLKELICPTGSINDRSFAPFIHDREVAGQRINLIGEVFPTGQVDYRFPIQPA